MLARVRAAAVLGVQAFPVLVEADLQSGLPTFSTVGLPDEAVRESRDRVRAAIVNSGYAFPEGRVTVNLAPADLRKEGSSFDLAIAVGLLAAEGLEAGSHASASGSCEYPRFPESAEEQSKRSASENPSLLPEPEAMLAINAARPILHYVDQKI